MAQKDDYYTVLNRQEPSMVARCAKCEKPVLMAARSVQDDNPALGGYLFRYTLAHCTRCWEFHLLAHSGEMVLFEGGRVLPDWNDPDVLYPVPAVNAALDASVPKSVAAAYRSAHLNFHELQEYTAAALICRRTLEVLCLANGATDRGLDKKLKTLKDKGVIDQHVYNWADTVLRKGGNEAAHELPEVSKQDAAAMLDFTKAVIEHIYIFQAAFERFKARKNPPEAPSPEPPAQQSNASPQQKPKVKVKEPARPANSTTEARPPRQPRRSL